MTKIFAGYKGGGDAAVEVKDTIQSTGKAYIVDLICEGEIQGLNKLYIDEAEFNSVDFPTVTFNDSMFRKGLRGSVQTPFTERYAGAKAPIPIPDSSRLRKTRPVTLFFNSATYPDATSVLVNVKIPALYRQVDEDTKGYGENPGDVREAKVEYWVTLTENGVTRPPVKEVIYEKSSGGFLWSTRIQLNPSSTVKINQWKLRIERITSDSDTIKVSNQTHLDSVIVETNYFYNYPNTVLAALAFDAQNYPQIGQRAYDVSMLKIKVPNGYTPTQYDSAGNVTAAATYPSVWNGTFSTAKVWTNNPAWVFYDLLTNKRYGLGEYVSESSVDKWTLYSIAKYCDALVDNGTMTDGLAGKEPRFACNLFLTTREEAFTVINNLASVFRGICYWTSGLIFPVQDRPKTSTQLFTNANVLNGMFTYSSSGRGQRRTVCNVRWNDPQDFYRVAIESVEDTAGVIRYGIREFDVAAFACTSRGQAHRVGKWSLLSERLETEFVSFDAPTDGFYCRPGDVIEIYDDFRYAQKQGGRIIEMNAGRDVLVLDRILNSGPNLTYTLLVNIPKQNRDPAYDGGDSSIKVTNDTQTDEIRKSFIESSIVADIMQSGDKSIVTVVTPFSEQYAGGVWTAEAYHASSGIIAGANKYRVINTKETEEKNIAITALEFDASKFDESEEGFTIRTSPTTDYSASAINPPSSLSLESIFNIEGEMFSAYIRAAWTPSTGPFLSHHVASGRLAGSGDWTSMQVYENGTKANYFPTNSGIYEIIVGAMQVGGNVSEVISSSVAFGNSNPLGSSVIPIDSIVLNNSIQDSTTIYADREPSFSISLAPSGSDGKDSRRAFLKEIQIRFKDGSSNPTSEYFAIEEGEDVTVPFNYTGINGWPYRAGIVEARTMDYWGNFSSTKSLSFQNPAPPLSTLSIVSKTNGSFKYILDANGQKPIDFSGALFWVSPNQTRPSNHYAKADVVGELSHNQSNDKLYVWWALADNFSLSDLNIGGPTLIDVGSLTLSGSGVALTVKSHTDDWGNEYNTLHASWTRTPDARDYYLYLKDNENMQYTYLVPQPDAGNVFYHVDSVVPDKSYQAAIQIRDGDGRKSAISSYCDPVNVPKPILKYLQVEGRSYFFEPTSVRIAQQTANGSQSIDFSKGNIIRVNLTNSSAATLSPVNIISGATYLLYLHRESNAGAVSFSSAFKWPDGDAPDISTSAGAVDVISSFAIDSQTLYSVAVNNMS